MNPTETDQLVEKAANGSLEAARFLVAWHHYCHALDDVVDGDTLAVTIIDVGRWANDLYSTPFYQRHHAILGPLVQLITITYEDSVLWQESEPAWRRQISDVIRHAGADMVRMVAYLTGGYEAMRAISLPLREVCYREHHDSEGEPR